MENWFAVHCGNTAVGKVRVTQQGLYYCFSCRCRVAGDAVYRLTVCCADKRENLGILVPVGGGFGIDTKLPAKRLGAGEMTFFLTPKHDAVEGQIVPVYPEEPFAYISRLKDAYLIKRNGKQCIAVK